jgi:hypothetical protein
MDNYNPETNPKAIFITQDEDGNWRGKTQRFGELVEVRDVGPVTVLQMLLTHSGHEPKQT